MENLVLSCLESRVENKRSFYGRFLLAPFSPGHGITVATALRRSLLSELDGVGISAVEISGVNHEFATIRGMHESILDFSLNLQNIVLTADSYLSTPEIGYLQMQGPGIVKASDLKLPYGVQCIDPDQYLATLSSDGSLAFKFVLSRILSPLSTDHLKSFGPNASICKFQSKPSSQHSPHSVGIDIVPKENSNQGIDEPKSLTNQRFVSFGTFDTQRLYPKSSTDKEKKGRGLETTRVCNSLRHVLLLDSVFSPVNRVNFLLEADDLSRKSRDRVILEVWTNGSITPRQAIHQASLSLIRLFSNLDQAKSLLSLRSHSSQKDLRLFPPQNTRLVSLDIGNLSLSVNTYIYLKQANINTLFDLISHSKDELLNIKGIGEKRLDSIEKNLLGLGLCLVESEPKD